MRTILVAAAVLGSGCTHYVLTAPQSLAAGTPVRVRLSEPQSFDLSAFTARGIDRLDAEVIRVDPDDDLVVSALWLDAESGRGFSGEGWTVSVPGHAIATVERRRLSIWRTAVVVGGILAGTYLGFDALGIGGVGGTGSGRGGAAK